jgi:hypothetical protein
VPRTQRTLLAAALASGSSRWTFVEHLQAKISREMSSMTLA